MTHSNHFVACIKSNNKILREQGSKVALPFGSEYSILLKNLKSVRALVEVTIDGVSATDGKKLILTPNSDMTLERSIRNNNLEKGNAFKFIERTSDIEEHRGITESDGLIRIEFWAEKIYNNFNNLGGWVPQPEYNVTYSSSLLGSNQQSQHGGILRTMSVNCASVSPTATSDMGITVPGSVSDQKFSVGSWFKTESESTVIVFELVGKIDNQPIQTPITVQAKPECVSCGKKNAGQNKFCANCGTSLIIF